MDVKMDDDETVDNCAKIDGMVVEGTVRVIAKLQGVESAEKLTFLH